jgi:ethylbenzene dioxygenase beta subunit
VTTLAPAETARAVEEFLYREAELLDGWRLREWLALLTEDVRYRVPVRIAKERGEGADPTGVSTEMFPPGVSREMFHLDEDIHSLELRIDRLATGFAWAEDPPSRLRHFVTNVRVAGGGSEEGGDELAVRSNVLVYRSRWDRPEHDLLSGERHDVLRRVADGELRLAERTVVLDSTTLPTLNLSFFL